MNLPKVSWVSSDGETEAGSGVMEFHLNVVVMLRGRS